MPERLSHLPGQSAGDKSKQPQWKGAPCGRGDAGTERTRWGPGDHEQEYRERGSHSWSDVWKGSPRKVRGILCHSDTRPCFSEGLISAGFMWHGWVSPCPFLPKKTDRYVLGLTYQSVFHPLGMHHPSGLEASKGLRTMWMDTWMIKIIKNLCPC